MKLSDIQRTGTSARLASQAAEEAESAADFAVWNTSLAEVEAIGSWRVWADGMR